MSRYAALFAGWIVATLPVLAAEPAPADGKVSYYKQIRPIFQQHCQGCHQPAKAQGGYVMTSHAQLLKKGDSDKLNVVAGKPAASQLLELIVAHGGKPPRMPKGEKDPLIGKQVELIKNWIAQGASDDTPASARQSVDGVPTYLLPPVLSAVAFSPDGKLLAVSGYHEVLVHKADGSGLVARLIGLSERIESLAFSRDGKFLAVAGGAPGRFGEIQIWDIDKKKLELSAPVTFDTVYGVSWSHDGTKVAFGCADNTLRAIDPKTGKQILYQGAHSDWVLDTVFSKDSSHLISVSRDRSMKLTEVKTQRFVDNITSITPGALKGGLIAVDVRPGKDEVVIGGADGIPKTYKIYRDKARKIGDDYNKIRAFAELPGRIFAVKYSPDGSRVVAASSAAGVGEVRVFETDSGKPVAKLAGQKGGVYAVAFSPDGKTIVSAGFDGLVRLNETGSGKLIKEFVPVPLKSDARTGGRGDATTKQVK